MPSTWTTQSAPSLDDFARLAREAFDALPEPFRSLAGDVVIRVDDFADDQTLAMLLIAAKSVTPKWWIQPQTCEARILAFSGGQMSASINA